jgi:3-deoxy-D-manno-octulosonic-acid transferase
MVVYRMLRHQRYRTGWSHRFGNISRKSPEKGCIWIHAVSVGEVNATKTIIEELQNRFGEIEIVVSTTTDTGFARANALYGDDLQVFYFPLDLSWIVRRAFQHIRPSLCLLMELEVWPNFVHTARQLDVPVVVVNGRISDNSFSKYKKIAPIARRIFRNVSLILAQTDEYARRFIEIGCPAENVVVTGSLKYDTAQITDKVEGTNTLAKQLEFGDEPLWVAGGTGNNEEKIILDVYRALKQEEGFSRLRLAIVPRKPERFDEVAQLIEQYGFGLIRYSRIKKGAAPGSEELRSDAVILGDTMGDLRKFYSLATVVFVGRSLVPMGGSDMIEAAALGKACLFGPHTFNFTQSADDLLAGDGAVLVKGQQDLLEAMMKCLTDPAYAAKIAQAGQNIIRKNQGATQKSIEHIAKLLTPAS